MRQIDYPMVGNGHRRAGPAQDQMRAILHATGDLWLEWWCRPERCRGLIEAAGADASTGRMRVALLLLVMLTGCNPAEIVTPADCSTPVVDTVVVQDTLIVSTRICLTAPPIGEGW